jgi:hypothetical protein
MFGIETKYLIIATVILIIASVLFFRKKLWAFLKDSFLDFTTVKIYVGGMVPNETRLALIDDSDNKKVIFNELCDEFGEFNYRIKRKYVGKKLRFPIRQSPFKFNHEEKVVIQPWGYFEAIRMEKDYSDANREKMSDEARKFDNQNYASEKYFEALYKSQFLARNQINITTWFIMVSTLTVIAALIGTGVDYRISILISLAAWAIRALLKKRTLGLSKKPINN